MPLRRRIVTALVALALGLMLAPNAITLRSQPGPDAAPIFTGYTYLDLMVGGGGGNWFALLTFVLAALTLLRGLFMDRSIVPWLAWTLLLAVLTLAIQTWMGWNLILIPGLVVVALAAALLVALRFPADRTPPRP